MTTVPVDTSRSKPAVSAAAGAVTLGKGKQRPQGALRELAEWTPAALAELLAAHVGTEAWWSFHAWEGDYRAAVKWRRSWGIALDVDTPDHRPLTVAERSELDAAARAGTLPGHLFHLTPAGARLILMLPEPLNDGPRYRAAWRAFAARARQALDAIGLHELRVDESAGDLARFFYAPKATAKGIDRRDSVIVVNARLDVSMEPGVPEYPEHPEDPEHPDHHDGASNDEIAKLAESNPPRSHSGNRDVFNLARALLAIAPTPSPHLLRALANTWAGRYGRDADLTYVELVDAVPRVRLKVGTQLTDIIEQAASRARECPAPEALAACRAAGFSAGLPMLLAALCAEMSRMHGGGVFRLPCRPAAAVLGCNVKTANLYLLAFEESLLELVERGTAFEDRANKANAYRWRGAKR
jgi:hypothetical protein